MVEPIIGRQTNEGTVRDMNEDSLGTPQDLQIEAALVQTRGTLVAVADGMGGHAAGEIASQLAIQELFNSFYRTVQTNPEAALKSAYEVANNKIFTVAANNPTQAKMGTTLASALIKDNRLYVANVGDSRVHLIRGNHITQLTTDHSWVMDQVRLGALTLEEARHHQFKNVITRAVGTNDQIEVDILRGQSVSPGDLIVLCSDGLSNLIPQDEMLRIANAAATPQAASEELIRTALGRKADDNITAIVVRVPGEKRLPIYWIGLAIVIGVILLAGGVSMLVFNPAAVAPPTESNLLPTQIAVVPSAVAVINSATPVAVVTNPTTVVLATELPSVTSPPTDPLTTPTIPTTQPTDLPTVPGAVQQGTAFASLTPTRTVTRTPTALPVIYNAPVLVGPPNNSNLSKNTILLWSSDRPLQTGDLFDVLVWREGTTEQTSLGNSSVNEFRIEFGSWKYSGASGRFLWTIRVIRNGAYLSAGNPPFSFNVSERAAPPVSEPTEPPAGNNPEPTDRPAAIPPTDIPPPPP